MVSTESPIEVRLLGRTDIRCGDVRLDSRLSARSLLVCAMLLTSRGEPLKRDEVAFALWPDEGEAEARAALRRELYKIQRAFPPSNRPWIVSNNRSIAWGAWDATWVDVVEFERLSADPETAEGAVELYRGEFAPQLDHEWAGGVRERLAKAYLRTLQAVIERRRSERNAYGMLHYVERLLEHDPWREDAISELLLLRAWMGDRAGALWYYRDFCKRLRAEFGVEPMPETVRCYERVAGGQIAAEQSRAGLVLATA